MAPIARISRQARLRRISGCRSRPGWAAWRERSPGASPDSLVVVDGPLSHGSHPDGAVGYIKRQYTNYLPPELRRMLLDLPTGRRTPLFLIGGRSNRYSWYQRLAVMGGPGGGIVRCETSAAMSVSEAVAAADQVAATLPRYASEPHKDGRAPQNLYPIAGLERALRRRLGDPRLMERALRLASV